MALAESIFAAISADTGVQAATGIAVAPYPIYPNRAPDSAALPFIVTQLVAGVIDATQREPATGQFMDVLMQFSCYASTYAAARNLRRAIINALLALDTTGLAAGEKFCLETERDLFEPLTDSHHCIIEVRFFCDPTAP